MIIHPELKEKLSLLLKRAFPSFVLDEDGNFHAFMQAYYEWMEQEGYPVELILQAGDYRSIERTTDDFIQYFMKEFVPSIPSNVLVSKDFLIQHIKDYYRAKGSEASYRFLFRIMFNDDVDFYYPGRDILRASDGKWQIDKSILCTSTNDSYELLNSRIITGQTSGASAIVENVVRYTDTQGIEVTEFFLSSISGSFVSGEYIVGTDETDTITISEQIYPVISSATVVNAGASYIKNSSVPLRDRNGKFVANAKIKNVNSTGGVTALSFTSFAIPLEDSNYGFDSNVGLDSNLDSNTFQLNYYIDFSGKGNGAASASLTIGTIAIRDGRWINTDGQLSSDKVLQDNFFYQDYSYVLKSNQPTSEYREAVKRSLHPAGTIMFGQITIESDAISTTLNNEIQADRDIFVIVELDQFTYDRINPLLTVTGADSNWPDSNFYQASLIETRDDFEPAIVSWSEGRLSASRLYDIPMYRFSHAIINDYAIYDINHVFDPPLQWVQPGSEITYDITEIYMLLEDGFIVLKEDGAKLRV